MISRARAVMVLIVLFLSALVCGGIFILKDKWRVVEMSREEIESAADLKRAEEIKEKGKTKGVEDTQESAGRGEGPSLSLEDKIQMIARKTEELAAEIKIIKILKSSQIKGIYVGSASKPDYFKKLLEETELNGVVIDVKEATGPIPYNRLYLKELIEELHRKNIWVIARICVFRDSSLTQKRPDWYLSLDPASSDEAGPRERLLWQDERGQYWLDPGNEEVHDYIIDFSKTIIDYGFDELQFDYIRYPVDYPGAVDRIQNIGNFFKKISQELRAYRPSIILSVDLFGYVAVQFNSFDTGQRLMDAGKYFDYLSFMLYPSHFYAGFEVGRDPSRGLPALKYSYPQVIEHPYQVILRSVLTATDYLSWFDYKVKIRPWLQDFDLAVDQEKGIVYDAEKVRAQIQAARDSGAAGWLLWNPTCTYTQAALE